MRKLGLTTIAALSVLALAPEVDVLSAQRGGRGSSGSSASRSHSSGRSSGGSRASSSRSSSSRSSASRSSSRSSSRSARSSGSSVGRSSGSSRSSSSFGRSSSGSSRSSARSTYDYPSTGSTRSSSSSSRSSVSTRSYDRDRSSGSSSLGSSDTSGVERYTSRGEGSSLYGRSSSDLGGDRGSSSSAPSYDRFDQAGDTSGILDVRGTGSSSRVRFPAPYTGYETGRDSAPSTDLGRMVDRYRRSSSLDAGLSSSSNTRGVAPILDRYGRSGSSAGSDATLSGRKVIGNLDRLDSGSYARGPSQRRTSASTGRRHADRDVTLSRRSSGHSSGSSLASRPSSDLVRTVRTAKHAGGVDAIRYGYGRRVGTPGTTGTYVYPWGVGYLNNGWYVNLGFGYCPYPYWGWNGCSWWSWPAYCSWWYPYWCYGYGYSWYWWYAQPYPYYPTGASFGTTYNYYYNDEVVVVDDGSYAPVGEAAVLENADPSLQKSFSTAAERYLTLGDRAFREGRYADSVTFYAKAIQFAPEEGVLHLVLSDALFATGDYHYAAYSIRRAFELDPNLADAVVDKRTFYSDPAEFDRHLGACELYLRNDGGSADVTLVLAVNYLFGSRPAAAVDLLEAHLALSGVPADPAMQLVLDSARRLQYGPPAPAAPAGG